MILTYPWNQGNAGRGQFLLLTGIARLDMGKEQNLKTVSGPAEALAVTRRRIYEAPI